MTTRREFLKQSSVLAAGALVFPQIKFSKKPKVIIIGAGLAGLAAAHRLRKKGCEVTVLEARSRIGGRVFSYNITDDLVIELGAEWVGASHERVINLCEEFGLILDNNQFETHLIFAGQYFPKKNWDYSAEWNKKFRKILEDYSQFTIEDKKKLDKLDWWRFLVNNGIDERDLQIRELLDSTDFGETIRFVSAYAALAEYAESSEKNEMDFKIRGGNQKLAEKLAQAIGYDNIKLKHKVVSVNQSADSVSVSCSGGEVFKGDYLICTAPTYALTKIKWEPSLPEDKIHALNELQYARISKHAVLFSERFWEHEDFDMVTDIYGHYFYHATKNQISKQGVLISYTTGDKADVISRQNDGFKTDMICQSLKPAFGDISGKILRHVNYYWGTDEYSKGAYALYGRGQWFTVMPVLKKRFMNTFFAGEHLADWQGFMEGAIVSGEEAADEILY
ncbi:MAG: FAD-dependent oxidoreductase [Ignavibacteria bacterium]|nr:FAD-dependent oxidoreductase [Ignavibacteria bacterium]